MSTPQINWRLTLPILGSLIVHGCLFLSVAICVPPKKKGTVYRIALKESVIASSPKQSVHQRMLDRRPMLGMTKKPHTVAPVITSEAQQSMSSISVSGSGLRSRPGNDEQGYETLDLSASAAPSNIVSAEYTSRARVLGIEGVVIFDLIIDQDGRVQQAEIIKRLGYGLDQNALSAIVQSTFHAAKDSRGNAIAGRVIYKYKFEISKL